MIMRACTARQCEHFVSLRGKTLRTQYIGVFVYPPAPVDTEYVIVDGTGVRVFI